LYRFLKIFVRPALFIFCRKIFVSRPGITSEQGPLLLACNHPNSFLDAVILDMLFEQPVWSLARGDVFKNKFITRILTSLKILPVYRTSEGSQNLSENYRTFDSCIAMFRNNGIVSIFSEGKCINEWHLRPLKKGTARLAIKCWEENIPLKVLPVGINYSSFGRFGKNIYLNFGDMITSEVIDPSNSDGLKYQSFNNKLNTALKELVFEIPQENKKLQTEKLSVKIPALKKMLLFVPAALGYILHLPLYLPIQGILRKKAWDTGHYDSLLVTLLLFLYPVYLFLCFLLAWYISNSWYALLLLLIMPFCAWACVQLKTQLD
jgi:1-acyl-sn-glycerol-3-phosphate acyltransferase